MDGYGQQCPGCSRRVFTLILLVIGMISHLMAMLAPYWIGPLSENSFFSTLHAGIWYYCTPTGGCVSLFAVSGIVTASLQAVQALAILAVLVSLFSIICNSIFLRTGNRTLLTRGAVAATVAGVMVIIEVIIVRVVYNGAPFGWAFYLEAVSGGFMLVAGAGQFSQICARSQRRGDMELQDTRPQKDLHPTV